MAKILMSPEEIKRTFPHASKSTIQINTNSRSSNTNAKSGVRNGFLEKKGVKAGHPEKCMVRITSYRVRLADVEGLCPKWHVDALRYAGAIEDDTIEALAFEMSQKKVNKKSQEKTLIEVIRPWQ